MARSIVLTTNAFLAIRLCCLLVASYVVALPSMDSAVARRTDSEVDICSRNMPCGWAICVWTAVLSAEGESCRVIKNTGCRCLNSHECAIDPESMEPTSYERPYIKYEYLCRKQSRIMAMLRSNANVIVINGATEGRQDAKWLSKMQVNQVKSQDDTETDCGGNDSRKRRIFGCDPKARTDFEEGTLLEESSTLWSSSLPNIFHQGY